MKKQKGFTLIELVVVLVILGILAAVAVPRFVDLKTEARAAALQGVKGGIESASAVNYAARSANSAKGITTTGLTCSAAAAAIMSGGIPTGYTVNTDVTIADGDNSCTLTQTDGSATATVNIIGVS